MSVAFSKPPFWQGGTRYLNDVNDSVVGGAITALPTTQANQGQQNIPGDRIILDAATALALSDTTIGTLYSGVYQYVNVSATHNKTAAVRGCAAFWVPLSSTVLESQYLVSIDAQPSTTVPTAFAGVFINVITLGNYGWLQISGLASCLFDSSLTATADGNWVSIKVSSAVASCFDCGAVAGVVTLAGYIGTALGAPSTSAVSTVYLTRGFGRW